MCEGLSRDRTGARGLQATRPERGAPCAAAMTSYRSRPDPGMWMMVVRHHFATFLLRECRDMHYASLPAGCAAGRDAFSAGVAELVDALDLGSSDESRGGSSPFARTKHNYLTVHDKSDRRRHLMSETVR